MLNNAIMYDASPAQCRLMDEAYRRAVALGRPFHEEEVFLFIWQQGIDLYPRLDPERFALYREGRWKGRGDKKQYVLPLWIARLPDEAAHIEDDVRTGVFDMEEEQVSRRLSTLAIAQLNRSSGELRLGSTDAGMYILTAEEANELLQLLYDERDTLYALAHR